MGTEESDQNSGHLNTWLITSFRFRQPNISISIRSRADRESESDFTAELGTTHILYPSFATVITLFSIRCTCHAPKKRYKNLKAQGKKFYSAHCKE